MSCILYESLHCTKANRQRDRARVLKKIAATRATSLQAACNRRRNQGQQRLIVIIARSRVHNQARAAAQRSLALLCRNADVLTGRCEFKFEFLYSTMQLLSFKIQVANNSKVQLTEGEQVISLPFKVLSCRRVVEHSDYWKILRPSGIRIFPFILIALPDKRIRSE